MLQTLCEPMFSVHGSEALLNRIIIIKNGISTRAAQYHKIHLTNRRCMSNEHRKSTQGVGIHICFDHIQN